MAFDTYIIMTTKGISISYFEVFKHKIMKFGKVNSLIFLFMFSLVGNFGFPREIFIDL